TSAMTRAEHYRQYPAQAEQARCYVRILAGLRCAAGPVGRLHSLFWRTSANVHEQAAGGGSGIRTHDTVSRIHAFQACPFSHPAIPPGKVKQASALYSEAPVGGI